jgi:hypothetical protein
MFKRRPVSPFSLSFLDVISCGFGAIILLFVITIGSRTEATLEIQRRLREVAQQRLAELEEHRTEQRQLQAQMSARLGTLDDVKRERERLQAMIEELMNRIQYESAGREALLVELQEVRQQLAAFQLPPRLKLPNDPTPVGLPVGSNHLAFVIDTSGSMRDPHSGYMLPLVISKIDEILDVYPIVDGIQVLDADGRYMVRRGGDSWMDDSLETRDYIRRSVLDYRAFSNSNPVPGIMRAIRALYDPSNPEMAMGIYIMGDEFTGTADTVLRRMNELNPIGEDGTRPVVINAIGFPNVIRYGFSMGQTGLKYANLMRELTFEHGGAFIALNDSE